MPVQSRNTPRTPYVFDETPQRDLFSCSAVINLHLKNGDLARAESLFRRLPVRNVVVESMMVDGYVKAGEIEAAKRLFDEMGERNVVAWTCMVSGYCSAGRVEEARRLFDEMPARNVVSWTTMVLGYARNGRLSDARELFDRMPERNVVAWTAMIKGYVENGETEWARKLFDQMPHRNLYSWNVMISAYLGSKQVKEAIELFEEMPYRNAVSWTTMVSGLAQNGFIGKAREFFDLMPKKDTAAWNAMITAYTNEGLVNEARELFDIMPKQNLVTWNAMIDGYAKNECKEEASRLFSVMLHASLRPNETTLTSILMTCRSAIEIGQIHGLASKIGFQSETSLGNALVTMYSRSGDLSSSWLAFKRLNCKDLFSWTSIILSFADHGCGNYALQVFAQMLRQGFKPDEITFVGVLSACSHVGLVEKGKKIFEAINGTYGLEPMAQHYTGIVDLLGRAGLVEEAKKVVDTMPVKMQDEAVLGALLGACKVHNEIEVAREVGEKLIGLGSLGSGGYTLLANLYASHGNWNDVARVRRTMKERNVKKVAGYSCVEVKMENHVFFARDQMHQQAKEVYEMLKEMLLPQMKDLGSFELDQLVPD
ncbi:Pentatricopeptide repeat-containing protein [Ananas comosus]|uniref:Pentatricopeptide repeat-containing protein n=1 Tax=Ananas comosus TaxID=4615 RepID=A0A199VQ61_ANACO|nr:Pentatricopeptide repeat-containing protein [Ananas comosus]